MKTQQNSFSAVVVVVVKKKTKHKTIFSRSSNIV